MWLCTAWFKVDNHPMFFVSQSYEPEYFRKKGKQYTRQIRVFNPRVAGAYDTYESLVVAKHGQRSDDVYAVEQARRQIKSEGAAA